MLLYVGKTAAGELRRNKVFWDHADGWMS